MSKLPSIYLNSKLFHRGCRDDRDTKNIGANQKALPDPGLEPIEPEKDSETKKAVAILKTKPDTTGKLEGKFKIPLNAMIRKLNQIIEAEYSQWMRYYHYAIVMRGYARDALAAEFEEHAEDELEHLNRIAMRVVGLGGYPTTSMDHPVPLKGIEEILKELLFREQEGVELYRNVLALCGDNEGTRQVIEGNIEAEQEHIDELWRYLNNPDSVSKAGADQESAGRDTITEGQAKRRYEHSFNRVSPGISGGQTPDLPERGRDWHAEVPGVPDEPQDGDEETEIDRPPTKILGEPGDEALKALAGAPRFTSGPLIPPVELKFLQTRGYNKDDILSGKIHITPRLRAEFNKFLTSTVQKSISGLEGWNS